MQQNETTRPDAAAGLDYGGGSIGRLFSKMFFPTLLGLIFNALLTVIDGIFVGRGVGPNGIAAVNIVAPLYMVVTGLGLMLGIGSSVVASIAMAQGAARRASVNFTQACVLSCSLMVAFVALLLLTCQPTLRLLGCSDGLMAEAVDYLTWLAPGMLFLNFECIGMMVIRMDGSPKFAMVCNIVPAVANIVLDYVLVFPCGMGVKGAAIATSASTVIGAAMVLAYFLRFSYAVRLRWSAERFARNLWHQATIGSSAFISEIAMAVMMLTGNYVFMRHYGEAGVAAFSIACYLFPVMFMMSNAVAQSSQPIISYNYGAGNRGRVGAAFRLSVRVALLCGAVAAAAIAVGAPGIVAMFIDPGCEAGRLAIDGLPAFATCAVPFAMNISFIGYYQSVERVVPATLFTLMRGIVVLVPLFWLLPELLPGWGVWAAIPASEAATLVAILAATAWRRRRR